MDPIRLESGRFPHATLPNSAPLFIGNATLNKTKNAMEPIAPAGRAEF